MITQEHRITTSTAKLDVVMREDENAIDDVIVTGYQTISKHQVAGAVKQIKMEDINLGAKYSVDQMLQGQVTGVNIIVT